MNDLKWFILILVAIWFLWFLTGGPEREEAHQGPFLKPPQPLNTGGDDSDISTVQDNVGADTQKNTSGGGTPSSFKSSVVFVNTQSARHETDPQKEYLEIQASHTNSNPIVISGWTLKGANGTSATIGLGSFLPHQGQTSALSPISLKPGESAFITTGESPVGVSFLENKCSGYFEQFQDFYPPIRSVCPLPPNELSRSGNFSDSCRDFVSSIPQCSIFVGNFPQNIEGACASFTLETLNYNGCSRAHQYDQDFSQNTWRIFLGKNNELWQKSDFIQLLDHSGKQVSSVSY